MIVISTGCPSGVGPALAVRAAARLRGASCVLVGDVGTLRAAAELVGVAQSRLVPFRGEPDVDHVSLLAAGPELTDRDRRPGRPGARAGAAQLAYVEAAYA